MNCSTIGLELSSLIKTPTVAVKQKCPETSMSCQSLRQMEVEVFRAPRNPILNNWDQSVRPPTITGQIPGVPMAPAPSRHRGHRRIPCASSPDWGRIHYYGLNNLVVKFSGEQNCLCFMVCKLESFAGIPNRHLLQSGLSQSDQLAAHHTGCSTTEAQSRSPGEPPRKPESTWRPRWKGPFGIQIGFGRSHNGLLSISCSLQCFFLALMYRRLATEASLRCLATSSFHQGAGGPFLRLMVFSTVLFLMILFKSVIKSSTSAMELRLVKNRSACCHLRLARGAYNM
ncbi:uncharacterized protein LOC123988812 isoform X2 [Osmia bicornis bicornis]|uniref:uncharacterized protein LOC123988812 isoform X2 n=1 Tax=Osmia bicornis bicornis TaxID=1437191 RepID=UPI001EAF1F91|nr:uncharacterized protein LOC123988812 isoform X2 [Osmia bicornis bicornis]